MFANTWKLPRSQASIVGFVASWYNLRLAQRESDTLLACLGHIILRHNVNPRIGDDKVQSCESGSPRLDEPYFKPLARFLCIPVVDKLLQALLPFLCRRNAKIVPDEARQHA